MHQFVVPPYVREGVHEIEQQYDFSARELASAICASRYKTAWVDNLVYLRHSERAAQAVHKVGLDRYEDDAESTRHSPYMWIQYFAPIAAHMPPTQIAKMLLYALSVDPGIKTNLVAERLNPIQGNSFWYSVGGNRFQDQIIGDESADELRANVLGIHAAEGMDFRSRLSDIIAHSDDAVPTVEGHAYRNSPYMRLAEEAINPQFLHKALRTLAQRVPFTCKRIVPVERIHV